MMAARTRLTGSSRHKLTALLDGAVVGQLYQSAKGTLGFRYEDSWRSDPASYPLSLSLPLHAVEHRDRAIRSYLWGLLPDNPQVLEFWAKRYGVSRHKVVDLLTHFGEDCAGAVQFATPSRVANLLGAPNRREELRSIRWISEADVGELLKALRLNPAAGRSQNDTGQFSLAGAQPKTALYQDDSGRWGVPSGRVPTNRILKPPVLPLDDLAYNEQFCLHLAQMLGMPAAQSRVEAFGDEVAIVVERYDRVRSQGVLIRVHQEDACQALGVLPTAKYESEGGPGVKAIVELLRQYSSAPEADVLQFVDAMALNWLLVATDGHAKNYSVLHVRGPQLRLAPLYDVISLLPYPQLDVRRSALAMGIGGERRVDAISGAHWRTLAREIGLDGDQVMQRVATLARRVPLAIDAMLASRTADKHARDANLRLGAAAIKHCAACAKRV